MQSTHNVQQLHLQDESGPLRKDQLKRLHDHKYSCNGKSLIEPIFQKFWCWFVELLPYSVAPNTLTLIGLIFNVLSVFILVLYSPDAKSPIPSFWLIFACLSLFVYQTLDALDGKQARRTNTSSALGELFDHGCDSFSSAYVVLGTTLAVGMGDYPKLMFAQFFVAVALFYLAHWQCYVTGTLQFGKIDVTEAQMAVMIIYLISAVFGVEVWTVRLPLLGLELRVVQFLLMMGPSVLICIHFASIIQHGGKGKHGATIANTSVVFPACPFALVVVMAIMVASRSPHQLYQNHPCLFLLSFGSVISKITNKLVMAHMTKSEITLFDSVLIGPCFLLLNQYFNCPANEVIILWCCCLWSSVDAVWYAVKVCIQIANFLNLYLFRVDKPPTCTDASSAPSLASSAGNSSTSYNSAPGARRTTSGGPNGKTSSSSASFSSVEPAVPRRRQVKS